MKICVLTPRFPFPENGGDVLRINNIARYLRSRNHEIILCSLSEASVNESVLKEANKLYNEIYYLKRNKVFSVLNSFIFLIQKKPIQCGYYYSKSFYKKFNKIVNDKKPDLYISHLLRMESYLDKKKFYNNSIIEMTDALSKTYALTNISKKNKIKTLVYKVEKNLIKKYEQSVISKYKKIVLVSQKDIEYLGNKNSLFFYTNGINCLEKFPSKINSKKIVFVGNMRTVQNQDAVDFFINSIFPKVLYEIPDAQFHIVGAEPPEKIKKIAQNSKNIFVTGFVESVEDYIQDSCVLVAPVNIAAGIQNKVLIGMACRIPVIMTSLISKAIPELENGKNCFIEDDENLFAKKILLLMTNIAERKLIAENGYELVKKHYSWNSKLEGYDLM